MQENTHSMEKVIFPGLFAGICFFFAVTGFLATRPGTGRAMSVNNPPVMAEQKQAAPQPKPAALDAANCSLSPAYPQSVLQWCGLIEQYAHTNGVNPNLISAVMLQESAGKADAYSKSGAVGLLQVMPRDGKAAGFMCLNGPCFADRPSTDELYEPEFNVSYGSGMLSALVQRYGDLREALKAYGPKDVGYYYADIVLGIMNAHATNE